VSLLETWRSFVRQDYLYAQGRHGNNGSSIIVTNAEAGDSLHNYGLAFDAIGDVDTKKKGRQRPYDINWDVFGDIVKQQGLEWGGDFASNDMGHVQMTAGLGLQEIKQIYKAGGILNVWRQIEVLSL